MYDVPGDGVVSAVIDDSGADDDADDSDTVLLSSLLRVTMIEPTASATTAITDAIAACWLRRLARRSRRVISAITKRFSDCPGNRAHPVCPGARATPPSGEGGVDRPSRSVR